MTAIDGLERLETTGLWRPEVGAQRREVYVAIGNAELVVQDKAGMALSHWSLPALVRLNPGVVPARFAPARTLGEELEIDEGEMVDTLDRVVAAVAKGRARPGRLRRGLVALVAVAALATAAVWLPDALRDQAARMLPQAKRDEIGTRMLAELTLLTGAPCRSATGREALEQLRARILPTTPLRIEVLRGLPPPALALPGGLVVLSEGPLVMQDDPDVVAGHLLAAATSGRARPPLGAFLGGLGLRDLMGLLTAGDVSDAAVTAHVERLLLAPPEPLSTDALRQGFAAARLAWQPYAGAVGLPQADVAPVQMPPALDDPSWQRLRGICDP